MAGEYSLRGLALPESLDLLHTLLVRVRADYPEIDEVDLSMFETAIVEIHGNVIEHGSPRGRVVYAFELRVHDDRLVGILADTGSAVPDLSEFDAAARRDGRERPRPVAGEGDARRAGVHQGRRPEHLEDDPAPVRLGRTSPRTEVLGPPIWATPEDGTR